MFPTSNTFDYMAEYQRIWSKPDRKVVDSMQLKFHQSPIRSAQVNRSSSSTDSTSPESYFDHSFVPSEFTFKDARTAEPLISSKFEYKTFRDVSETRPPFAGQPRPILGKKFLADPPQSRNEEHVWPIQNRSRNYELFPSDNSFDLISLRSTTPFRNQFNSPRTSSPIEEMATVSSIMNPIIFEKPVSSLGITESKICTFCKKNGERPKVYTTHWVKEKIGNKFVVTCPVLRSHVCSQCGETGDKAHTITYCPVLRTSNNGKRLQSTTITLKNTRVLSNGRKRLTSPKQDT